MGEPTVQLCFVCLGNICRSPTAEAIMHQLVLDAGLEGVIEVDSAGTAGYHVGDSPDRRASAEAERRGVAMISRARRFHPGDFDRFDLVLAMDEANVADLHDLAQDAGQREKVHLLRSFDPASSGHADLDVPDPYYGEGDGFARVFDLVDAACRGLLAQLIADHDLR